MYAFVIILNTVLAVCLSVCKLFNSVESIAEVT